MPNETITVTKRDIRETARILRGLDDEIQNLKEKRQSEGTPRLIRAVSESAEASDSVVSVSERNDTTMVWDGTDGWDYSEWIE